MTTLLADVDIGSAFKLKSGTLSTTFGDGIRGFVSQIFPNVFIFAGLILLIFLVAGGIGMIASAGNPEAKEKSKKVISNAIFGFIIVFASFWIIQIIQVLTGVSILRDF